MRHIKIQHLRSGGVRVCRRIGALPRVRASHGQTCLGEYQGLHHDAHTGLPGDIADLPENSDARVIHLHDCIHALARGDLNHVNRLRRGHGIAVESDHLKLVAGQSHAINL